MNLVLDSLRRTKQFMKINKYLHEILLIGQEYFWSVILVETLCRQKYDAAGVAAAPGQCATL